MIKITSFHPFQGWLKVTQEFHEDKAFVKMKSLTFEREFEFEYKDVHEISETVYANNSQMNFGFWLLGFTAFTLVLCRNLINAHSILLLIEQVLYVCGLFLFITSFKKSWQIDLSDKNGNFLTNIKRTRQNHDSITKVIDMIKNNSEHIRNFTVASPFPDKKSAFEHTEFEIPNLRKTTTRFYENEIIGFQKSIFAEYLFIIQYSQLNGKVYRGKSGNDLLGISMLIAGLIVSIILGFIYGFGIHLGITPSQNLGYFVFTLLALSLISWPLGFLKREVIGLYDKNGSIAYWTYINKTSKDNVERTVEFIQSKISHEIKI